MKSPLEPSTDIDSLAAWLVDLAERLDGIQDEIEYVIDNLGPLMAADLQESIPDPAELEAERQSALAAMTAITFSFLASHLPELKLMNVQELVRVEQWEGREADLKYHHLWYAAAVCSSPQGPLCVSVEREEADGELIRLIPDYWAADCLGGCDGR